MSTRKMARSRADKAAGGGAARNEAARNEATPPQSGVVRLPRGEEAAAAVLGMGAHFAKLFKKLGDHRYEAHLMSGQRFEVGIAPEVDPELADLCLAEQEIVLVGALGGEVVVFGALRTKARKPEEVVIEAPRRLVLRAGKSKLTLSADGKIKLTGDDVTIDAPREVRLASARVEIP